MPIEDRNLKAGAVLVARYKGRGRRCDVMETPDGVRYRLDDGSEHKSPSSAGKAVMGGVACNGWRFWSVQGTEPASRASKPGAGNAKAPAKAKTGAKSKSAKKAKTAKKPKGKAMQAKATDVSSYGCGACGAAFPTMKAATEHALTHTD